MSDSSEPSDKPPTYTETRDAMFQAVHDALHGALLKGLENHDKTVYRIGYAHGYETAWEEATKRFSALLHDKPQPPPPPVDAIAQSQRLENKGQPDTDHSAKDIVLALIRQQPGLRGVEIVQAVEKAGTPINERTIRTALHRLKEAMLIRNDDGRWIAADASS